MLLTRMCTNTQNRMQARAAEAELLGLLEEEEAKASKKQQKKGKGKGGGAGKGGEPEGATAAAAGLTVVSLADSDGEEEEGKAAAVAAGEQEHSEEGPLQGAAQLPPLSEEEAFVLARAEVEAPDFVCPLLRRVMRDVALASDGFSYERAAIEAHIRRCQAGALCVLCFAFGGGGGVCGVVWCGVLIGRGFGWGWRFACWPTAP